MIGHSIAWTIYAAVAGGALRAVGQDWRDPDADRRVTLIAGAALAALLAIIAVVIAAV